MAKYGLGVDIGGSGINGAVVDLDSGSLVGERYRLLTPHASTPATVAETVAEVVRHFDWDQGFAITFALIPNSELGHLEVGGHDAETRASAAARARDDLSWSEWAERLEAYYQALERYLWPELFVVGRREPKGGQVPRPPSPAHTDRARQAAQRGRNHRCHHRRLGRAPDLTAAIS